MARRPERKRVVTELGTTRTLMEGMDQFDLLCRGTGAPLFLGLGPDPALAGELAAGEALFVECPDLAVQLDGSCFEAADGPDADRDTHAWTRAIPAGFEEIQSRDVTPEMLAGRDVYLYRHGPNLFPSFWGPVMARVVLALNPPGPAPEGMSVLLPGREDALLVRELSQAFADRGITVRRLELGEDAELVPRLARELAMERPSLYCSINFHGLDPHGQAFHLLQEAGTRVAVWCVDNPWHLLTGQKSGYWWQLALFVTDHSFVEGLEEHGAEKVFHLPLAAWPSMAGRAKDLAGSFPELEDRLVFVGRSSFPDKQRFFASHKVDAELMAEAREMLLRGERPDFQWWRDMLGVGTCWPGKVVRAPGLGAEESGLAFRAMCLQAAAELGLTVFGDAGWRELLGRDADLRDPVDYYGPLAGVYAGAKAQLNMTSPLLPAGLTQRHFDVWTCGGFLLTDATPGLDLFPEELVEPVRFQAPRDIPVVFDRIVRDASLYKELKQGWQAELLERHQYGHRVDALLEALSLA